MRGTIALLTLALVAGCGDDSDGSADAFTPMDLSPPTGETVGGPCETDGDCDTGLTCDTGERDDRSWTGGYCTRECELDTDCPFGSRCAELYTAEATGATVFGCAASCDREIDGRGGCRDGYMCDYDGVCLIGCSSDADCQAFSGSPNAVCETDTGRCQLGSNPGTLDGTSCTVNDDCAPNQGCLGGSCAGLDCDLGGERACTNGWTCNGWTFGFDTLLYVCGEPCTIGAEDCPAPFRCRPEESDPAGLASGSYCGIDVTGGGASPDATIGDGCTTNADCPSLNGLEACREGICTSFYCAAESIPEAVRGCADDSVCEVTLLTPGQAPRAQIRFSELGVCLRPCAGDPSLCAEGAICTEAELCLGE